MEISVTISDFDGTLLTGKTSYTALKIRRVADGFLLDWDDLTFKGLGWGHNSTNLVELDATNLPGEYRKVVVVTGWNDGYYQIFVYYDDTILKLNFTGEQYIQNGKEIDLNTGATVQTAVTAAMSAYVVPTQAGLDADVAEILAKVGLGAGAITWTYTLTRSDTGQPIADANVWVTTDIVGNTIVASGVTDNLGVVTFYLDAGVVYVWRQKAGYNFINPDAEAVS